MQESTLEELDSSNLPVDYAAVRLRAKEDFDFFAGLALPTVMYVALPPFYIAAANILIKNAMDTGRQDAIIRFALGLPRGFIKTTFIKVLLSYFIVHDLCEFALAIASTEFHAENIVADVNSILASANMVRVYGDWNNKEGILLDSKAIKQRHYHGRVVTLAGMGAGSSIRGINIDNRRPDFLLCDDMQTAENDKSESESNALFDWFIGTLLKAINLKWCMIVYIGNMYSENCILFKLKNHPQWKSLITGCILIDGQSLWPELHSVESLYDSYKHDELLGKAAIWFAEMMNDPIQSKVSPLTGPIPDCPYGPDTILDGVFLIIDPAGFRRVSDENVLVVHGVVDQKGIILEICSGQFNPEQVIKEAIRLVMHWNIPLVGIEATGYQQTLQFWAEKYFREAGLADTVMVVPLETKKRSKDSRIVVFFQEAQSKNYFFARIQDRQRVVYQAMQYKIGKKNNKDDLLDGCAYGLDVRQEYWEQIRMIVRPQTDKSNEVTVINNNTPF